MACRYLLNQTYPLCTVVRGSMVPSLGELRAYCVSDEPSRCPLQRHYEATQVPIAMSIVAELLAATEAVGPEACGDALADW